MDKMIEEKTPLQKHVKFFDQNDDDIVMPWETYRGFRDLGFGIFTSSTAAFLINLFLSYKTQDSKIPNLSLPIYIKNISRGKHTSDSETYNHDGTVDPVKFGQFEAAVRDCTDGKDTITTLSEALKLSKSFKKGFDPVGGGASKAEWAFLWMANNYKLTAQDIKASYDGSLFEAIAKKRNDEKEKQSLLNKHH